MAQTPCFPTSTSLMEWVLKGSMSSKYFKSKQFKEAYQDELELVRVQHSVDEIEWMLRPKYENEHGLPALSPVADALYTEFRERLEAHLRGPDPEEEESKGKGKKAKGK